MMPRSTSLCYKHFVVGTLLSVLRCRHISGNRAAIPYNVTQRGDFSGRPRIGTSPAVNIAPASGREVASNRRLLRLNRTLVIMHTSLFDYDLPPSLIARFPATERTASRLLRLPPDGDAPATLRFAEIGTLLKPGDVLVANNTGCCRPGCLRANPPAAAWKSC